MTLRTVAEDRFMPILREIVREPIGAPVLT